MGINRVRLVIPGWSASLKKKFPVPALAGSLTAVMLKIWYLYATGGLSRYTICSVSLNGVTRTIWCLACLWPICHHGLIVIYIDVSIHRGPIAMSAQYTFPRAKQICIDQPISYPRSTSIRIARTVYHRSRAEICIGRLIGHCRSVTYILANNKPSLLCSNIHWHINILPPQGSIMYWSTNLLSRIGSNM